MSDNADAQPRLVDANLESIEKTTLRMEERFSHWEDINRRQVAGLSNSLATLNKTLAIVALLLVYIAFRLS